MLTAVPLCCSLLLPRRHVDASPSTATDPRRISRAAVLPPSHSSATMSASAPSAVAASAHSASMPSALAARGVPHTDKARWKVIYPIYINVAKKVSEGRKLPKNLCVEKPSVYDIADMATFLKLPFVIEDKCYSRDFWERGRVRIQLKDESGTPLIAAYPDRRTFLRFMASKIPSLKTRAARLAAMPPEEELTLPMDADERAAAKASKKADKKAAKKKAKK